MVLGDFEAKNYFTKTFNNDDFNIYKEIFFEDLLDQKSVKEDFAYFRKKIMADEYLYERDEPINNISEKTIEGLSEAEKEKLSKKMERHERIFEQKMRDKEIDIDNDIYKPDHKFNWASVLSDEFREMVDDVLLVKLLTSSYFESLRRNFPPEYFFSFKVRNKELVEFFLKHLDENFQDMSYLVNYLHIFEAEGRLSLGDFKSLISQISKSKDKDINKMEFYKFLVKNFPNSFSKFLPLLNLSLSSLKLNVLDGDVFRKVSFDNYYGYIKKLCKTDIKMVACMVDVLNSSDDKELYMRNLIFFTDMVNEIINGNKITTHFHILQYMNNPDLPRDVFIPALKTVFGDNKVLQDSVEEFLNHVGKDFKIEKNFADFSYTTFHYGNENDSVIDFPLNDISYDVEFTKRVNGIYNACFLDFENPQEEITTNEKIDKFSDLVERVGELYNKEPNSKYENKAKTTFIRNHRINLKMIKNGVNYFSDEKKKLDAFKNLFKKLETSRKQEDSIKTTKIEFKELLSVIDKKDNEEENREQIDAFISSKIMDTNSKNKFFDIVFEEIIKSNSENIQDILDYIILSDRESSTDKLRISHNIYSSEYTKNYNKYNISSFFSDTIDLKTYTGLFMNIKENFNKLQFKILLTHYIRFCEPDIKTDRILLDIMTTNKLGVTLLDFYFLRMKTDIQKNLMIEFLSALAKVTSTCEYVSSIYIDYYNKTEMFLPPDPIMNSFENLIKDKGVDVYRVKARSFLDFLESSKKTTEKEKYRSEFLFSLFSLNVKARLRDQADNVYNILNQEGILFLLKNWHILLDYVKLNQTVLLDISTKLNERHETIKRDIEPEKLIFFLEFLASSDAPPQGIMEYAIFFFTGGFRIHFHNNKVISLFLKLYLKIPFEGAKVHFLRKLLNCLRDVEINDKNNKYIKQFIKELKDKETRNSLYSIIDEEFVVDEKEEKVTEHIDITLEDVFEYVRTDRIDNDPCFSLHIQAIKRSILDSRLELRMKVPEEVKRKVPSSNSKTPKIDKRPFFSQLLDPYMEEEEMQLKEEEDNIDRINREKREKGDFKNIFRDPVWFDEVVDKMKGDVHTVGMMDMNQIMNMVREMNSKFQDGNEKVMDEIEPQLEEELQIDKDGNRYLELDLDEMEEEAEMENEADVEDEEFADIGEDDQGNGNFNDFVKRRRTFI